MIKLTLSHDEWALDEALEMGQLTAEAWARQAALLAEADADAEMQPLFDNFLLGRALREKTLSAWH